MDLYGSLFQHAIFPIWESKLKKRPTLSILRELEKTQWLSLPELKALQLKEFRRLVRHAYDHVPYYREAFERAGIPREIESLEVLPKMPLLSREIAQREHSRLMSTRAPFPEVKKSTSGSTGQAFSFGYDLGSEYWRQAIKFRGYGWAGYSLGRQTIHLWGIGKPPPWRQKMKIDVDRALKREHYVDCTRRGDADHEKVVTLIKTLKPHAIVGYASAAVELAAYVNRKGVRDWGPISVICGADKLFPHDRETLQKAFGKKVFETYGSRETMLVATECEAHAGLHVSSENILVEVVVREGDRVRQAAPGEVGEIVVTDLHNYGMPFIRYLNGDLGALAPDEKCACGRELPRLVSIDGRVAETLRDGKGGKVGGLIFSVCMVQVASTVRHFQVVQHKDDSVTVRIVRADGYTDETERGLLEVYRRYLSVPIRFEYPAEIPLTLAGKRKVIVVE